MERKRACVCRHAYIRNATRLQNGHATAIKWPTFLLARSPVPPSAFTMDKWISLRCVLVSPLHRRCQPLLIEMNLFSQGLLRSAVWRSGLRTLLIKYFADLWLPWLPVRRGSPRWKFYPCFNRRRNTQSLITARSLSEGNDRSSCEHDGSLYTSLRSNIELFKHPIEPRTLFVTLH